MPAIPPRVDQREIELISLAARFGGPNTKDIYPQGDSLEQRRVDRCVALRSKEARFVNEIRIRASADCTISTLSFFFRA